MADRGENNAATSLNAQVPKWVRYSINLVWVILAAGFAFGLFFEVRLTVFPAIVVAAALFLLVSLIFWITDPESAKAYFKSKSEAGDYGGSDGGGGD